MNVRELVGELMKWPQDAEVQLRVEDVEIGNKNCVLSHVEMKKGVVYLIDDNVFTSGGEKFGKDWGFTPEQVLERERKEEEEGRRRAVEEASKPLSKERLDHLRKHGGLVC